MDADTASGQSADAETSALTGDLVSFFELSIDMLAIASMRDGTWVGLNAAVERTLGWAPHELIGTPFLDIVHPDDRDRSGAAAQAVGEGRALVNFEHRVRCKNGFYRWIGWQTVADFRKGVMYCVGRDMTESHSVREAQRESEARQEFMLRLSDALRPLADPQAIRAMTCRLLGQQLRADWVAYGEIDTSRDTVDIDRGYAPKGEPPVAGKQPLSAFGWTLPSYTAGTTIVVSATRSSDLIPPAERAAVAAIGMTALISVPLLKNGELVGALAVSQKKPRDWSEAEVRLVEETAERIWNAIERARAENRLRESESRLQVLVHELQHRTRNLMGVVRATAAKTLKSSSDLADFYARFESRIDALARVQGLLSRLDGQGRVSFDQLIRDELVAMGAPEDSVTLEGPPGVRLRSSTVQLLSMALHELATNAIKYGALGQPDARLSVCWRIERHAASGDPWLHIAWSESGVTMPARGSTRARRGQGRDLIEKALPYQLKARTSFELGRDGLRCTILMPVSTTNAKDAAHA